MRSGAVIIPDVPGGLAPGQWDILTKLKQAVEVLQGTQTRPKIERRAVTFQDLVELGLITEDEVPRE